MMSDTMENKELEAGIKMCRIEMEILGAWPDTKYNQWYLKFRYLVPIFLSVFFINIPQTRMLIIVKNNLDDLLEILTTADLIVFIALIKFSSILAKRKDLMVLLNKMRIDWNTADRNHKYEMRKSLIFSKLLMSCYNVCTSGTIIIYAASRFLVLRQHNEETRCSNTTSMKPMFIKSKFFFETEYSPMFEIIWIGQFIAAFVAKMAFVTYDGFFIFSILHLSAQLINLKIDFRSLPVEESGQNFTQSLKCLVQKHWDLKKFRTLVEENFNQVFLVQMMCYSVTLCLQSYQIVTILTGESEKNSATLEFIVIFTISNILSLFMYCYMGEKLSTESSGLHYAVYEIEWYRLKPSESKLLMIVMHGTKKPLVITAGKFTNLSLSYFMQILKTASGYLSMLLAVQDRL
ncbi:odorant receptor 82a-like [Trichogramma pretiosum]|uniref:odorant receptor 82a-like n=1 Tax=Trichogramma pretiosum TaxID=7493 RepID=UPI000C71970C|nr:odorant receptor 82a-like [Trichogramma pretiosum]